MYSIICVLGYTNICVKIQEYRMQNRPFLKWAGGKQRCLPHILPNLPQANRLIEPFTGAGAIFLNTNYPNYLLGEINFDLVNLFSILRDHQTDFINYSETLFRDQHNSKASYYQLRNQFNQCTDSHQRAALFVYLNRHGFNGLCRYNSKGMYNVPYGTQGKAGPYFPKNELIQFANKAKHVEFICQDFRDTFAQAMPGDVIYCDPPYVPIDMEIKSFSYHQIPFNIEEQSSLASHALTASKQGIPVIISNHDTPFTRMLYKEAEIISFPVQRFISCNGAKRQQVKELVAIYHSQK